jgi:N-acetylglucosaminyldiphosphoundecaprenol N-acetyl-beta-D-mannosaminyltransferase
VLALAERGDGEPMSLFKKLELQPIVIAREINRIETAALGGELGLEFDDSTTAARPLRVDAEEHHNKPVSKSSDSQPGPAIAILGIPFDNVTTLEAMELIERMVASRQPHYLVTANVDFLVQSTEDIELRRILLEAHMVVCDGTPLVWASHLLGNPLPERVAGADLVPLLIRVAAEKKYRLFFLGSTPESVGRAVNRLQAKHPELIIAGYYSPPFNKLLDMDHEEIRKRILEAKPDLLFVCFGCPKQEKWIAMHYRSLGVPLAAGVGATIDFLAGQVKRAPIWMQRIGTEWIYRLLQEPRRLFRRYLKDLWVFSWAILGQWWRFRYRPGSTPSTTAKFVVQDESDWRQITIPEYMDLATARSAVVPGDSTFAGGRRCLLDCSKVRLIDSTGIGLLIRWQKQARAEGGELILLAPSPALRNALRLMKVESFFSLASDIGIARHMFEARTQEQAVAVQPRTAAASSPLVWRGEITAANAESVWQRTEPYLASPVPRRDFVIDLSAVRFIDSTGLGLMIRAKKLAQRQGTNLIFTGLQPPVRNVLRLARLEEFLLGKGEKDKAAALLHKA